MTDEMMALQDLLKKTSDADLLREMLGFSRLCEEIDERVGAFLNRPLEGDWRYLTKDR